MTEEMLRKRPEMRADGWKVGEGSRGGSCMRATAATCSGSARWRPSWSTSSRRRRAFHASQLDRADRNDLAVAREQCEQRDRAFVRASLFPQRHSAGQEDEGKSRRLLVRAARVSCADQSARDAGLDEARREAAGLLRELGGHHAARARRHSGRGAEVDRFLDLEDRERTDRLSVRKVQGHLPLRAREGTQGLHDVSVQPGSVSRRAGEGEGPQEHDLSLHARGRQRRSRSRATRRSSTTARRTRPRISSMRSKKATTASSVMRRIELSERSENGKDHNRQEDREVRRREGRGREEGGSRADPADRDDRKSSGCTRSSSVRRC